MDVHYEKFRVFYESITGLNKSFSFFLLYSFFLRKNGGNWCWVWYLMYISLLTRLSPDCLGVFLKKEISKSTQAYWLVRSQLWKHQFNMWNLFKVNNKGRIFLCSNLIVNVLFVTTCFIYKSNFSFKNFIAVIFNKNTRKIFAIWLTF